MPSGAAGLIRLIVRKLAERNRRSGTTKQEGTMARSWLTLGVAIGSLLLIANPATAQKKYDPGATDTEIKIGNTNPYSGPASAYGLIGKTMGAYFTKVNAEGGINGRKINYISYDDAYSPPRAVEQVRKLVESDEVLLVFQPLGTPSNTAIQKYMNSKKVPQLFVATGATKWGDPKGFPWTMGWQPNYQSEGRIYAKYILEKHPNGKIAILYQNDDYGKDYMKGLKDGLGDKAKSMIIAEAPYETSDPTVDSQMINLKASGADIFFNVTTPKFAAQAIRKAAEIGWTPVHFLNNVSNSAGSVLKPAGLEHAKGILSTQYTKDPTDPSWKDDAGYKEWLTFMEKYFPEGDKTSSFTVYGYSVAQTLVQVLKQCGDTLTRENVMKQAASLKDVQLPMLVPGIRINTSSTDYYPIEQMQMMRFTGERWEAFGGILSGEIGGS
jgi:branched-chain amino acid transport system substrate-binding protein